MRVGFGYDSHRFVAGRPLMLGGVHIPFELGLLGHSDADALSHSIIDALFGAAAVGDIGTHFPVDDDRFLNASGVELLKRAKEIIEKEGYRIVNIDATAILQAPKLAPYVDEMRKTVADALEIDVSAVSIKAKTEEGMGFVGRLEGVRTSSVCLIEKIK